MASSSSSSTDSRDKDSSGREYKKSSQLTNTHFYDRILSHTVAEIKMYLDYSKKISITERYRILTNLALKIESSIGRHNLMVIVGCIGKEENLDKNNQVTVDDLLVIAYQLGLFESDTWMRMLEEQLVDMKTGFCSEGRTHRILQIILPCIREIEE